MEGANHFDQTINLGQKIVKDLDLEESCDTLGKWMAHYLAEKIVACNCEQNEDTKNKIHEECKKISSDLADHLKPPEIKSYHNELPKISVKFIVAD